MLKTCLEGVFKAVEGGLSFYGVFVGTSESRLIEHDGKQDGFAVTPTLRTLKKFFFPFVPDHEPSALTEVMERSLLSLLFIPLLALVFLLVWKVS